jgi:hypothetical protein
MLPLLAMLLRLDLIFGARFNLAVVVPFAPLLTVLSVMVLGGLFLLTVLRIKIQMTWLGGIKIPP